MSRQRPRRSRSLVGKMRGKFERNRRSRSLTAKISPDEPVNVFASDMVSTAFVLNRLQQVEANRMVLRLEVEDLIVNGNRDALLPSVKNLLADNRGWKSVSFVDSVGGDQFSWWVHLKRGIMAEFDVALAYSTLDREVFTFQACVQVRQGTRPESLLELLRSIRRHNDVFDVNFAGALYGYGEASMGVALAEAFDQGNLSETITINVKSGWRKNPYWSNMLDACIRAILTLTQQQAQGHDQAAFSRATHGDLARQNPVDFPGVELEESRDVGQFARRGSPQQLRGRIQLDHNSKLGPPRRSRSATGLPRQGHRSSVLSRVQGFEHASKSDTGPASPVSPTKSASAAAPTQSDEEPSFSWEARETKMAGGSKGGSHEVAAYSWENRSYALGQAESMEEAPAYSWELSAKHLTKRKSSRTSARKSKDCVSVSSEPLKPSVKRSPPPRRHSASGATSFSILVVAPSDSSRKARRPPRRSKSTDFTDPKPPHSWKVPPKRSMSNDFAVSSRPRPKGTSSLAFTRRKSVPAVGGDTSRTRRKPNDFHHPTMSSQGAKRRQAPRRTKSEDFEHPTTSTRSVRRSKSNDFVIQHHANGGRRSPRRPTKKKSMQRQRSRTGKLGRSKSTVLPKTDGIFHNEHEDGAGPDFDWSSHSTHFEQTKKDEPKYRKKGMHVAELAVKRTRTGRSKSAVLSLSRSTSAHEGLPEGGQFDWASSLPKQTEASMLYPCASKGPNAISPDFNWSSPPMATRRASETVLRNSQFELRQHNEVPRSTGSTRHGRDDKTFAPSLPDFNWANENRSSSEAPSTNPYTATVQEHAPDHDWRMRNLGTEEPETRGCNRQLRRPNLTRSKSEASLCPRTKSPTSVVADDIGLTHNLSSKGATQVKRVGPDYNWHVGNTILTQSKGRSASLGSSSSEDKRNNASVGCDHFDQSATNKTDTSGHANDAAPKSKNSDGSVAVSRDELCQGTESAEIKNKAMPSHLRRSLASEYSLAGVIG